MRLPAPRRPRGVGAHASARAHTQKSQHVEEIQRRANVTSAIAAMVDEQAKRVQVRCEIAPLTT